MVGPGSGSKSCRTSSDKVASFELTTPQAATAAWTRVLDKEAEVDAEPAAVVQGSWSLGQGFLQGLGN